MKNVNKKYERILEIMNTHKVSEYYTIKDLKEIVSNSNEENMVFEIFTSGTDVEYYDEIHVSYVFKEDYEEFDKLCNEIGLEYPDFIKKY